MKPMIGKSIDQSMTIDALLVNWHRPINDQSIITQKWSQLIDWHWLALKKSHTFQHVSIRTRSTHKCLSTGLFVCSFVVSKINNRNTLWNSVLKKHKSTTHTSCFTVPFAVLYTVDIWSIWIFRNFIFLPFPIFPTGPVHTLWKMRLLLSDLSM